MLPRLQMHIFFFEGTGAYITAYIDPHIHWNLLSWRPKRRNRLVPEFHYVPWLKATYDDCCKCMGGTDVRNINGWDSRAAGLSLYSAVITGLCVCGCLHCKTFIFGSRFSVHEIRGVHSNPSSCIYSCTFASAPVYLCKSCSVGDQVGAADVWLIRWMHYSSQGWRGQAPRGRQWAPSLNASVCQSSAGVPAHLPLLPA